MNSPGEPSQRRPLGRQGSGTKQFMTDFWPKENKRPPSFHKDEPTKRESPPRKEEPIKKEPSPVKSDKPTARPTLQEILHELQTRGSSLWKIRSPSQKSQRKFILDKTNSIHYEPTHTNTSSTAACFGVEKKKKQVELEDISAVRKGWKTDVFNEVGARESKRRRSLRRKVTLGLEEDTCFSIVYGPRNETLDLMASNPTEADKWVRALEHLLSTKQKDTTTAPSQSYEAWLRKQFNAADVDKNKSLTFQETLKLLKNLNIAMEEGKARELFDEANQLKGEEEVVETTRMKGLLNRIPLVGSHKVNKPVLDEDEFITFYFKLFQRPEVHAIFKQYAGSNEEIMSADQFLKFLREEQKNCEITSVDQVKNLIQKFEPSSLLNGAGHLSLAGLTNFLMSSDIFDPGHRIVYQDMTLPMTNYFIASSHNTYLVGNQLSGRSSVEGYVSAFQRGCRCVELDCWDGEDEDEDDQEPVIYHGYTLTTKILFKEVLTDAVVPYAFATNPYPVILSIENHCSAPYQQKMVNHLTTILGPMLYSKQFDPDMKQLPSPEQLKGKVIVRSKRSTVTSGSARKKSEESLDSDESDGSTDISDEEGKSRKSVEGPLSSVLNIFQNSHFHSFEASRVSGKPWQTSSIGESKALKLVEEQGADFVDYNTRQVTRIYPGGTRTGSSNFNPIPFWTAGCQLVALNYQTEDTPNFYNYVQFSENGRSGYVLKPKFLRGQTIGFDPNGGLPKNSGVILRLRIISGQHLPKAPGKSEIIDPYVKVKVAGLEQDKSKYKTKVVRNNGFNPIWEEPWETHVNCPELAFVIFKVYDYVQTGTDEQLAHYGIPMSALTTGYRNVPLVSKRGTTLTPSSLFVHVSLTRLDTAK